MLRLTVIAVSDAFREFWNDLAVDLGIAVDVHTPAEALAGPLPPLPMPLAHPETVAIILAAGGRAPPRRTDRGGGIPSPLS